jgi:molybdopterin converting factor small subunit
VLAWLESSFPGLAGQLRNADGTAHKFVNVYVNDDDARYLDGLDTKLSPTDEVSILPAVAGG